MDGKISEQRVYCKIQAQLGFPPTEIHADLQKVYGNGALKYATVCKWVRRFNDCRESIESIRRDKLCHLITKFCMFCLFSLHNKSVSWSDQALTLSQTTNFRHVQIERVCRRQFQI